MADHEAGAAGINLSRLGLMLAALWTLAVLGSLLWNQNAVEVHALHEAKGRAVTDFENDLAFRRWNASHGGVYVPVTEETPPNPYLGHVPERDVTTTTGRKLTLMNPAYMVRQLHEQAERQGGGMRGHITSLKPLRPDNAPDAWEAEALKAFARGETEMMSLEKMEDGRLYLRYMRPMLTEQNCLKCHEGYKVGDIRGGVSVSVPMDIEMAALKGEKNAILAAHSLLWVLGVGLIAFGSRRQAQAIAAIQRSESRVRLLLESTAEAIYGLDLDGRCTFANLSCLQMLGYEDIDELLGRDMHELIHHSREDGSTYPVAECPLHRPGGRGQAVEEVLWRKDGSSFMAECWSHQILEGERSIGTVVTFLDISKRKSAERAIANHVNELERFQRATVQREFRIKELREEIKLLQAQKRDDQGGAE